MISLFFDYYCFKKQNPAGTPYAKGEENHHSNPQKKENHHDTLQI
jgi:hypothetical protein